MHQVNIYIDIETIPTDREDILSRVEVSPPASYKKQETIDKWHMENGEDAKRDAIHKLCFNGGTGKICCISWAIGDGKIGSFAGVDEVEILNALNTSLKDVTERIKFVGHNVQWDLRYIWQRMVINKMKPLFTLNPNAAPWHGEYYDTMTEWAGIRDKVSLDDLCLYLGVDSPKGEMDGSKVWQAYKDGRFKEIAEYCMGDVEAMRRVYKCINW